MDAPTKIPRTARKPFEVTPAAQRSAIGNGTKLLDHLDARSSAARRYKYLQADIAQDLGGDAATTQLQLARSRAGLVVLRERLDEKVLAGEPVDSSEYARIANSVRRLCSTIGLTRVPRDITPPSLSTYLRQSHEPEEAA